MVDNFNYQRSFNLNNIHRLSGYFSSYDSVHREEVPNLERLSIDSHTPMAFGNQKNIRLISWNILSPDLTAKNPNHHRDIHNVEAVNPHVVDMGRRIEHIGRILATKMQQNEIICLQEVSESTIPMLRELCDRFSYSYVHDTADRRPLESSKGQKVKVLRNMLGLAILFPNRQFSKVAAHNLAPFGGPPVIVDEPGLRALEAELAYATSRLKTALPTERKAINDTIKVLRNKIRTVETVPDVTERMKDRGVLLIVLQDIDRPDMVFAVATTHVPCDFSNDLLMQEYAVRIKRKMAQWMHEHIDSKLPQTVPLLFCGDMNSNQESAFYSEFLRDSIFQDVYGSERDENMCTLYSFSQSRVQAGHRTPHALILDHIFIPHNGIEVVNSIHPMIPSSGIPYPNEDWPSDHLAVEIVFRISTDALFPQIRKGLVLYKTPTL